MLRARAGASPGTRGPELDDATVADFRGLVREQGRRLFRDLPWRRTRDPYRIMVSEVMLQQTQVSRVIRAYGEFLAAFPNIRALAASPTSRVVIAWLGLGYNRRALALHKAARVVAEAWAGVVPEEVEALESLPGIGHATACAISVFAFERAVAFIETNVRSVFLHHFFPSHHGVSDRQILPLVEATLDRANPREWYWALMDYGSHLKSILPNPSRNSAAHRRQPPFEGSHRQLRGRILRHLALHGPTDVMQLSPALGAPASHIARALRELHREGFVHTSGEEVALRDEEPELAAPGVPAQPPESTGRRGPTEAGDGGVLTSADA